MSCSVMVWATLVMLPASLVRVRALKAFSCLITYSGCWPATRGISFCPENPPRWHMVHSTSSAFFLPRATRAASARNAPAFLEVLQLKIEIAGGLAREHRKLAGRRVAVGAMAGGTSLGLALAPGEIGVRRRQASEDKSQGKNPFHPVPQKNKGRPRAASQDCNDQGRANTTTLFPRLKSICVFPPAATATYCLPFTV